MAWTGTAEMLRKKKERRKSVGGWVEGRRGKRERQEERKRYGHVGAGKEEMAFSGVTVGPLYCGPDPLCCEGTCGSTGQCLRTRSL